jgi:hypothetical protein
MSALFAIPQGLSRFAQANPKTSVFLFIFLLCLAYLLLPSTKIKSDLGDYREMTEFLLAGHPFHNNKGEFKCDYPPVQPIVHYIITLIAQFLHVGRPLMMALFNILWYALSGVAIYQVLDMLQIKKSLIICLVLAFFNPMVLFLVAMPNSEVLYILFYALSTKEFVAMLVNKHVYGRQTLKPAIWSGIWFGLGWLTRPISLFLPFAAALVMLFPKKAQFGASFKVAFVMLFVSLLTTVPWQYAIITKADKFYFLSSRGINGLRDGLSNNAEFKSFRTRFEYSADIDSMLARFQANYNDYQTSAQVMDFLKEEYKRKPSAVINYYLIKAGRVFYGTDAHRIKEELFIRLLTIPSYIIYLLSIFYLWKHRKRHQILFELTVFTLLANLSVMFISIISSSIVRYLVPLMVINAIPAGYYLYAMYKNFQARRLRAA